MYEAFYGLREKPFELHPDPEFLYMSRGHDEAYTHLDYALQEGKGFVVITGEIGAGKTTLLNRLLHAVPPHVQVGMVNNTGLPPSQFLKVICQEFEIPTAGLDRAELLDRFNDFLIDRYSAGNRVALIVDEAQNLPTRTIEEIRLLSNLEAEKHHLLQVVLVGQPELRTKLQAKALRQFLQRVTVHCHLEALSPQEVAEYVRHRLRVAGAQEKEIFDEGALETVARHSQGVPRLINILCDTALVYGFAEERPVIGRETVEEVVRTRAAGGLLGEPEEEGGEPEPATEPSPAPVNGEVAGQLAYLNARMAELEQRIRLRDERLYDLAKKTRDIASFVKAHQRYVNRKLRELANYALARRDDTPRPRSLLDRLLGRE